jgi:hypothetical protein
MPANPTDPQGLGAARTARTTTIAALATAAAAVPKTDCTPTRNDIVLVMQSLVDKNARND